MQPIFWKWIFRGDQKFGNYIQSSSKFPQIIFFKAWISFSQGEFLLADCEGLAFAAGGRDKGASKLQRPAPFSLHPIPRHALWLVVLVLWAGIGCCAVERGRVLLFTRGIFFHTVNLVLSSQLSVPTPDSQLPTHNSQLVPEPVEAHQPSKSGGVLYISPNPFETENAPKTVRFSVPTTRVELVTFSFGNWHSIQLSYADRMRRI